MNHWQVGWVVVIIVASRIAQAIILLSIVANANPSGIGGMGLVITLLEGGTLAVCLAWLGLVLLPAPNRGGASRWALLALMLIGYLVVKSVLAAVAGIVGARVIEPAFTENWHLGSVLFDLLAITLPAVLLFPPLVRMFMLAGGHGHPRFGAIWAALCGTEKRYFVCFIACTLLPSLAYNAFQSGVEVLTNGTYLTRALMGAFSDAFGCLVAVAAARALVPKDLGMAETFA